MNTPVNHPADKLIQIMYATSGIPHSEIRDPVQHYFDHGEAEEALTCATAIISKLDNVPINLVEALVTCAESYDVKIAEYLDSQRRFETRKKL